MNCVEFRIDNGVLQYRTLIVESGSSDETNNAKLYVHAFNRYTDWADVPKVETKPAVDKTDQRAMLELLQRFNIPFYVQKSEVNVRIHVHNYEEAPPATEGVLHFSGDRDKVCGYLGFGSGWTFTPAGEFIEVRFYE